MTTAAARKWTRGTTKQRAKSLMADVTRRERDTLLARLHLVSTARKRARARIRAWARGELKKIHQRAGEVRKRCLLRIKRSTDRHAELVRRRRELLSQRADQRFGAVAKRRHKALEDAIRLERLIRDRERKALKARTTTTRTERKQESDDEVRRNLDADAVPIFDRVASHVRGTQKMTRTESFLHWAHEHPDEIIRMRAEMADQDVSKWLEAEHEKERERIRSTPPEGALTHGTWKGARFVVEEHESTGAAPVYALSLRVGKRALRWKLGSSASGWSLGAPDRGKPTASETAKARAWLQSSSGGQLLDDLSDVPF